MSSSYQVLSIFLGAAPYIAVLVWLLLARRYKDIKLSSVLLGFVGIIAAVAIGGLVGVIIIMYNPQTGSSINNSFLVAVLAASVAAAMLVGEMFRYFIVKRSINNVDENEPLVSLAYGIGFSLGEFLIFLVPLIMNWNEYASWDASVTIAVDVSIQIMVSIACFELIRQNNFAFIAVGGLYYLTFFLSYALHNSVVLNIAAKALVFFIAIALMIVLLPRRKTIGGNE